MPLLRDDVDFCWRVHAAGHRVRVITDAVVYHLEATARNRRAPAAAPRPRRMDRHNALLTLLANLPLWPPLSALAATWSCPPCAPCSSCSRSARGPPWTSSRRHVPARALAAARHGPPPAVPRPPGRHSQLRGDLPPGRSVRRLAEFAASVFYTSTQIDTAGSHHATDDPSDDDYMLVDNGLAQRILTHPGVLLVAGLTVVALIAERSLLGAGTLTGGALTPAWGGASGLWQEYLQGFHPAGIGSASSTPPYVAVIAALATVLGGKPWLAIDVIMIGSIPLAGLSAFLAARRVTTSVLARVWAAAAYALLPVGMGAVAAGRFGSAVVFALIPLIALLAARIFTEAPRRARRAAWAAGLIIAIAAAFVPLVWIVAVLAALLAAVAFRRSGRGTLLNLGITVVIPADPAAAVDAAGRHPAVPALPRGREQGAGAGHGGPACALAAAAVPGRPGPATVLGDRRPGPRGAGRAAAHGAAVPGHGGLVGGPDRPAGLGRGEPDAADHGRRQRTADRLARYLAGDRGCRAGARGGGGRRRPARPARRGTVAPPGRVRRPDPGRGGVQRPAAGGGVLGGHGGPRARSAGPPGRCCPPLSASPPATGCGRAPSSCGPRTGPSPTRCSAAPTRCWVPRT